MSERKPYRFDTPTRNLSEREFLGQLQRMSEKSGMSDVEKFAAFPVWAPRQNLARFLAQAQIYSTLVLPSHGSVVECGVAFGAGLMTWAHLASILEPVNHTRRVIGFDTFEGFPGMAAQDAKAESGLDYAGGMAVPVELELLEISTIHDMNRPLGHVPRVEIVKGDACKTIPQYMEDNKHLVVSLLVLDFDIYEPTKVALETFLPRMPRGSVIMFDELNCKDWPGETMAALPYLRDLELRRIPYTSTLSYAVI